MNRVSIATNIVLPFVGLFLLCGADEVSSQNVFPFNQYEKMNRYQLINSLSKLGGERNDMQASILNEMRDNASKQRTLAAIVIAGMYRMDRDVEYLAKIIDFRDEEAGKLPNTLYPLWGEYPAAEALGRIGNPAVSYLIDNLRNSDKPIVRRLSALELSDILGAGPARECLQEEIDKESGLFNDVIVSRLREALPLLDAPTKEPPAFLQAFDQISSRLSWELCGAPDSGNSVTRS